MLSLQTNLDGSFRPDRGRGTAWGVVDTAFALMSMAVLIVACVGAMYAWLKPGWPQLPMLAVLYLFVRAALRRVFELKNGIHAEQH